MNKRAETGKMQFGNDWSGVFIRGDNALMRYLPILMRVDAAFEIKFNSIKEFLSSE